MQDQKSKLGIKGEKLAADFLINKGFKILHCNWRFGHKEIDIIAQNGESIHFVEVKTRSSNFFEDPHNAVSKSQQRNIIDAADSYISESDIEYQSVHFDIIGIIAEDNSIVYIEEAFGPEW